VTATPPPVLIVDDEEVVRQSLGRLLSSIGYPSTAFPSAESFLESYTGEETGCLLLDLRMPGMSGLDLIEELRRRQSTLPVIVMTGHTDMTSMQRLSEFDTLGLLEKPFPIQQLKMLLDRWRHTLER
jgi:FixJ family two-component response regulator